METNSEAWAVRAITNLRARVNEESTARINAQHGQSMMTVVALVGWILFVAALLFSPESKADDGRNWCSDWIDGYLVGVCWETSDCDLDALEPAMCPYPERGEVYGYMRGLRDGLIVGSKKP